MDSDASIVIFTMNETHQRTFSQYSRLGQQVFNTTFIDECPDSTLEGQLQVEVPKHDEKFIKQRCLKSLDRVSFECHG